MDFPVPATADEFRRSIATLDAIEGGIARARAFGSMLLFEEALARHPFVSSLELVRRSEDEVDLIKIVPCMQIPQYLTPQCCGYASHLLRRSTAQAAPQSSPLTRHFHLLGVSADILEQAESDFARASEQLSSALSPRSARDIAIHQGPLGARDAPAVAMLLGLDELVPELLRSQVAPSTGEAASPPRPSPSL